MFNLFCANILTLLLFYNGLFASENRIIKDFKKSFSKLHPHLVGSSIISITSPSDKLSYSSSTVSRDSQFYIGSASKHMTAYMLLVTLHETYSKTNIENLLTAKLTTLFPDSMLFKQIDRAWLNEISLLDLLAHRSGLTDYLDAYGDGLTVPEALNKAIDPITLLQSISFDPKKTHLYSNSNYLLIGKLIEEINHDTLDHVFEKIIKLPANMKSSFAPICGNYFDFKKEHTYSKLVPNLNDKVFIDMANAVGPGNIISSVSDLIKWGEYLFKQAPKPIVNTMLKDYGKDPDGDIINLGLTTMDTNLGSFIGHQGGIDSYSSFFGYAPQYDALVLILSNNNDDSNKLMKAMSEWLSQPKQTVLNDEEYSCTILSHTAAAQQITPHKFTDEEIKNGGPKYEIPSSSRFTTKRNTVDSPDIVYYFSCPQKDNFPIAILCGGSSLEHDIISIIHFHRYFLKEFLDLEIGVITIEQRGIDGSQINKCEFMEHYTRSNRLSDHRTVVESLKKNPPKGWNGKLIFLGVSEGGPLVTTLTTDYSDITLATINWSGAGDFSWRDELWYFMQDMIQNTPWHMKWWIKLSSKLPAWMPFSHDLYFPKSRKEHDNAMDETLKNPTANLKLAGMTYKYHADALKFYPKPEYRKIKTPYLVVTGEKDSTIDSSDAFVRKAQEAGAPVTYFRISDMDHYVRRKDSVIKDSFDWLRMYIH